MIYLKEQHAQKTLVYMNIFCKYFLFWTFCPLLCQLLVPRVKVISLMGRNRGKKESLEKFKLYLDGKDIFLEEAKVSSREMS